MDKMKIFKYIKADPFFNDYLPGIKNYKRKITGRNSKGNETGFTEKEEKQIQAALNKLFKKIII